MSASSFKNLLFGLSLLLLVPFDSVLAQTDLWVRGSGKLFPIAVPQLCLSSGSGDAQKEIPDVIARDLDISGYFEVLNPNSYIEAPGKCGGPESFAFSDWSVIGTEGLVKGEIKIQDGIVTAELRLFDVLKQQEVLGKSYKGDVTQVRQIAHRFSNEIMRYFTGEPGVFGTQIAYSSRVGRFKELYVMDMDGSSQRQVTDELGLAVSSTWDPSGSRVLYTSYRNRIPDLFEVEISSRRVRQVTKGSALEVGAKYGAGAESILLSRTEGNESAIVLMSPTGAVMKDLTPSAGTINVSPAWSPDHSQILFVSNRGGGPQIYLMDSAGDAPHRISYTSSNYCTSPAWSPKGDKVAFVCRADRGHQLFIANPDGSGAEQLTSLGSNEDPDWSPDGRYIVFATTFGKGPVFNLALMRADGSGIRQLTNSRGGDTDPAWSPMPAS